MPPGGFYLMLITQEPSPSGTVQSSRCFAHRGSQITQHRQLVIRQSSSALVYMIPAMHLSRGLTMYFLALALALTTFTVARDEQTYIEELADHSANFTDIFGAIEDSILAKLGLTDEEATVIMAEALQAQSPNISSDCTKALDWFMHDLFNGSAYTRRVLDAWGKPPPAILDGNRLWFGAFDECRGVVNVVDDVERFRGQYCSAVFASTEVDELYISLGICVPQQCTPTDIKRLGQSMLTFYSPGSGMVLWSTDCAVEREWHARDIVALVIIVILGLLALSGTTIDVYQKYMEHLRVEEEAAMSFANPGYVSDATSASAVLVPNDSPQDNGVLQAIDMPINKDAPTTSPEQSSANSRLKVYTGTLIRVLLCFSWWTNGLKLLDPTVRSGSLSMLNGLRVLSMWWVILGHNYDFVLHWLANPLAEIPYISRFSFQAVGNATVSVDSFFFLSGLLVAYLTLKELKKNDGKLNWAMFYFHRFWRLTPVYMIMMMFWCTLYLHLPHGPMMRSLDQSAAITNCYKDWWTNLLYINNFYPDNFNDECMGWTWYLANDMQFYIISPILILLFYKWNKIGLGVTSGLIVICLAVTGGVARYYGVQPMTLLGILGDPKQWAYIYVRPYHRMAPYMVGLIIGYLLYENKGKVKIPKRLVLPGWALATACNMAVLYGLYGYYDRREAMQPDVAAFYLATHRFAWSLGLAWLTVACLSGYGGPINMFLSWNFWAPIGRLTYTAYLVHPMVIFFTYTSLRHPVIANDLNMTYFYLGHLVLSYMVAFVVSLLVEAPMMALEKVLFGRK